MPVREKIVTDLHLLGQATVTISSATTTSFDFGTPNDINLSTVTGSAPGLNYKHGDRVLVVFSAVETAGSAGTDTVSFVVQDADDSSGSIGTPATADTDGTLTGGKGTQYAYASVRLKNNRPWIRCRVTSGGATNTFVSTCQVFGVPDYI
jgi:hypothetical protein